MARANSRSNRVNLIVTVRPETIKRGQLLAVSCSISNEQGYARIVPRVYMEIVDRKGIPVWKLGLIATNTSSFTRMVSTTELRNGRYTIRMAVNPKMIYQAYAFFTVKSSISLIPMVLPIVPTLLSPQDEGRIFFKQQQSAYTRYVNELRRDGKISKSDATKMIQSIQRGRVPKKLQDHINRLSPEKKDEIRRPSPPDDDMVIPESTKDEFIKYLIYATELDGRVCELCRGHEGKRFLPDDPDIIVIGPPEEGGMTHYNCVLGNTIVNDDGIINITRMKYTGKVLEITTASGRKITTTPNHLYLTPRGFCAANLLAKGDDLIGDFSPVDDSLIDPNIHERPTTIEDKFTSFVKSSGVQPARVPASAKDLHGDAIFGDGYIDIIGTKRLLRGDHKIPLRQKIRQHPFIPRFYRGLFHTDSTLTQFLDGCLTATSRRLSLTRKSELFFFTRLAHPNIHGITSVSDFNPGIYEAPYDYSPINIELLTKCLDRHSRFIKLDKIIDIQVKEFTGFVYDMQTESTLYTGNGIILSNCRCVYIPIEMENDAVLKANRTRNTLLEIVKKYNEPS